MIILAVFTCRADGGGFAFAKLKAPVYHGPPSTIQLPKPITRIGHARFFKGKRGL